MRALLRSSSFALLFSLVLCACGGDDAPSLGDRAAGQTCASSLDCESGLCLAVSATRNVCTLACKEDVEGVCPGSSPWSCGQTEEISRPVCLCQANANAEVCGDGRDNDCDGNTDDCQICNGRAVPLDDRVNCGACGNVCPIGSACVDGACECPEGGCQDGGVTVECLEDGDCNDDIECTQDTCIDNRCIRRVVPARCPSGEVCDLRMGGCIASRPCADNDDCQDDDPCTTEERCDPSTKVCLWFPLDGDSDTDPPRVCGGTDCDDDDPTTLLGAVELCDGADNNCDGNIDSPLPSIACSIDRACMLGVCECTNGTECGLPSCIDLNTDVQHCGGCFNDCPLTATCEQGTCTCPNNGLICTGTCIDPLTDRNNCGACFNTCFTSQSCVSGSCIDTDECASELDNCDPNATCTNTNGGFTCACSAGFAGNGVTCHPNECETDADNCDVNATCTDTSQSFFCTCNAGYMGDGVTCTDRDECTSGGHNCDTVPFACVNSVGSFMCVCPTGYTGAGTGSSGCIDINECLQGTDNCDANANCTNSAGSFTCTCLPDFTGDGITCTPNAALTDLTSSAGTLAPTFAPSTRNYTINVPLSVESITLTPTADVGTEIRINTEVVASGNPSSSIALLPGANAINITVAGTGFADSGYVLNVVRGAATYVKASNTGANDSFGRSVAADGETVVVGAPYEDWNYTDQGGVYVFTRNAGVWSQQALLHTAGGSSHNVGAAVAISGDTLIASVPGDDGTATNSGAVVVFVRSGASWTQQAYLKASNAGASDGFGSSLAISGDTIVVGAITEDSNAAGVNGDATNNSLASAGAAYVFTRSGTTWTQQAYLKASNPGGTDYFGQSVSISGDTVVVGAHAEDSNATGVNGVQASETSVESGAAYVFLRSGTTWSQQAYLKAPVVDNGAQFGYAVSVSGNTVAIGAHGAADTTLQGPVGAVYVFDRSGSTWSHSASLRLSNPSYYDSLGISVSLVGDNLIAGAYQEDSNSTGINGLVNEAASESGAAYLYRRSAGTWGQPTFIKASNTQSYDYFGWSVAVTNSLIVVGAYDEDSSAFGINGSQTSNAASASGAVYIY